ncbi:MAG: DUF5658 family protein [Chloroflexota bacterium]
MLTELWASAGTFSQGTVAKVSFVLLNQLDLALTVLAASLGLPELNPFMRYLLAVPVGLLLFKSALPLVIAWLVPGRLLWPAIICLSLVAGWNVKELVIALF